jgi:hypothetical protein
MVTTEIPIVSYEDMGASSVQAPEQDIDSGADVPEVSLEERESALTLKENTLLAKEAFSKLSIPEDLLELVVGTDLDKQTAAIEKLSKAWTEGLKSAIKAKVAGASPVRPAVPVYKPFSEMSYAEKLSLKKTNPQTYRSLARK